MQISFNWLKEYIDLELSAYELQELMTKAGVTVEHVQATNKGIEKVVTAKVLEKMKHPNAEKLSICQVTTDGQTTMQVVCGAPNVAAGQTVAFALPGAHLPDGIKIKKAKLRGVESNGMICSSKELGIDPEKIPPEQKEGIVILPDDTPLGVSITEIMGLDDYILELDLTPNRSDCLSVLNVAREIGALINKPVKIPAINSSENEEDIHNLAQVSIKDSQLCHRYCAKMVKGVAIKPSPFWLQHRLQCAGVRPINNIVDITNYILMELGQPLHAFDYHEIAGHKITVRRAEENETIVTLDNVKRSLTNDMLLICDDKRPVAIAGVMGGENTEVTEQTTDVFIEAAYFQPTSVRKTSTRLGLRSEASIRFEKGINMETVTYAVNRAAALMQELGGGEIVGGIIDEYPTPHQTVTIDLELAKVNQVLGTNIKNEEIKDILLRLNFELLQESDTTIAVKVPPYRPDVSIAEDLIEEVARLYGYDAIPDTLPFGPSSQGRLTAGQRIRDQIINKMAGLGLHEVVNYSFINKNNDDKLGYAADDIRRQSVAILNPLSEEQSHMRTSILPGLFHTMLNNINRRNENLALFELGKIFLLQHELDTKTLANERWTLGIVLHGKNATTWQQAGVEYDFYYLKGLIEALLVDLKIDDARYIPCRDNSIYHPGRAAYLVIDDISVGVFGEVHPQIADNYGLKGRSYAAEIDVDLLIEHGTGRIQASLLPKFPSVTRDLAIVVDEKIASHDLKICVKKAGGALLNDAAIFDVYQGDQIAAGKKSIAFSLLFQADDRTLTDEEINIVYNQIYAALQKDYQAELRA